jgi:8-oxo-dGTP pyrophosphatase MutT (NUDIX family)
LITGARRGNGERMPAADDELLATFDRDGRPTGTKTRGAVHRDADWHVLAFVWAARVRDGAPPAVLLQVRGRPDDRFFGHVDAPAGGHVPAGEEPIEGALRECEEEMGVALSAADLLFLGRRRVESLGMDCKRSFQHHFLCRRPLGLQDVRHTPEVHGFVEVSLPDLEALVTGRADAVGSVAWTRDTEGPVARILDARSIALYTEQVKETFRLVTAAAAYALENGRADPSLFG